MTNNNVLKKILFISCIAVGQLFITGAELPDTPHSLPVTGKIENISEMGNFSTNKNSINISRVTVPGKFSYSVPQAGNSVPNQAGVVGQYAEAKGNGNIGLLAHNYLAGSSFAWINYGDEVQVTNSNGNIEYYVVNNILRFKASNPNDFTKPFIDEGSGQNYSARGLFNIAYKSGMVTFQTCIAQGGSTTWGIIFVQAVPGRGNVYVPPTVVSTPEVVEEVTEPVQMIVAQSPEEHIEKTSSKNRNFNFSISNISLKGS